MSQRCVLLVGTSKGAFVLDGDAESEGLGPPRARCARDGRSTTCRSNPAPARSSPAAAARGTGPPSGAATTWATTWTHSGEGLTYGDDGPKMQTVWNVTATPDAVYAGVEPAGLFRSADGGRSWAHVEGLTNHPTRLGVGAGQRRPHPPLDRPPSQRPGSGLGRDLRRGRVRDPRRRRDLAHPQHGGAGRLHARPVPGVRPVRAQARDGGRRRRAPVPAEPLRGLPVGERRRAVGGDHARPPVRVRLPDDRPSARPEDRLDDPAQRGRPGAIHARRVGRRVADARRRRHVDPVRRRACPSRTPTWACCARRWRTTGWTRSGVYFGTSTGQLYGSADEGRTWSLIADNLPPIWSVEATAVD